MEKTKTQPLEAGYQLVSAKGGKEKIYHIEQMLGRGGFGITYLATSEELVGNIPQPNSYTIKEFCISDVCIRQADGSLTVADHERGDFDSDKSDFLHEAQRLADMHYEGIVPVNEVFETNGTAYYVMQYLGDKSLVKYVKEQGGSLDEDEAVRIALAVAKALDYIHQQKVTHLDVKPENIMMFKRFKGGLVPVLIDFGLACHYKKNGTSTSKHSATGITDGYSPLEQYAGIERFSPEADVYALGATLFFMLTGKAPLKAADMSSQYLFKNLPDGLSDNVVDTLRKSMEKMAERRIKTMADFQRSLSQYDIPEGEGHVTVKREHKQPQSASDKKWMRYGLIGLAAVVVALLVWKFAPTPKPEPEHAAIPDSTAASTVQQTEGNSAATADIQDSQVNPSKPSDESQSSGTQQSSPAAASTSATTTAPSTPSAATTAETTSRRYLNLGYAEWRGPVRNGQPNGDGVMTFKSSHRIDSRDPSGNVAEAGDYIEGTYVNGHLDQGTWHKSSGGTEFLMIGQ